jgi:hypothetical protein
MRELVEQYKRIQGMKESLRHVRQDMPGLVSDEAIQLINDQLNAKLDSLAHQITNLIQGNPPEEPESAAGGYKPLWAVIAAGEPDYEARSRGIMGSTKYRMYFSKQDAMESIGDSIDRKVVPVWGE